jgi:fluoroacetyl-CoA thioesterase
MGMRAGLSARVTLEVGEADTALAFGSGDVAVLATPRVVALCEQAAIAAVDGRLRDSETTVGMRVQLDHLAPTFVGGAVVAEAVLDEIEGRRLTFTVRVHDACSLVAAGRVTRVVVDRTRFVDRAR